MSQELVLSLTRHRSAGLCCRLAGRGNIRDLETLPGAGPALVSSVSIAACAVLVRADTCFQLFITPAASYWSSEA